MRIPSLFTAARARLQLRPWGALLVLMGLAAVAHIFLGERPSARLVPHLAKGFLLALLVVALSPVPWQWTGDPRRMARPLRGLAQALVWNALWVGLLTLFVVPVPVLPRPFRPPVPMVPVLCLCAAGWLVARFQAAEGDRAEAMEGRRTLEITARQAQEQALKAQLDPHVLYNALSGISELIREDPEKAENAVLSLAELYRKLTALGRLATVSLGQERALLADYLAVEHLRLGDRLRVLWDWPEALDAREVPPLLLQPLVENAIKHGLAPRKAGGTLRIAVALAGAGLRFQVANDGEPLAPARQDGTGLANLAQRLALLGEGSRLQLRRDEGWTVAELLLRPDKK